MTVPQHVPIRREEGDETDRIGRYGDGGQFMAFVVASLPLPPPRDWQAHKRWYAVLHTFDAEGRHRATRTWFAGTTADGEERVVSLARTKRDELVTELGALTLGDISIDLFSVEVDGQTFGLVDASDPDEDYERIDLLPNDLAFFEPWDGSYST